MVLFKTSRLRRHLLVYMFISTFGLQNFVQTMDQMSPRTSWGGPNVFIDILDWTKCLLIKRICVLLCINQSALHILEICWNNIGTGVHSCNNYLLSASHGSADTIMYRANTSPTLTELTAHCGRDRKQTRQMQCSLINVMIKEVHHVGKVPNLHL